MSLGNRIKLARVAKGLSQEDLANALAVSRIAVSNWENGKAQPEAGRLPAIALHVGKSTDELLGSDPPKANRRRSLLESPAPPKRGEMIPVIGYWKVGQLRLDRRRPLRFEQRPPFVEGVAEAFALDIATPDMEPAYSSGDTLYLDPSRPARPHDRILVELTDGTCLLRHFVGADESGLTVEFWFPTKRQETLALQTVRQVYRVAGFRSR